MSIFLKRLLGLLLLSSFFLLPFLFTSESELIRASFLAFPEFSTCRTRAFCVVPLFLFNQQETSAPFCFCPFFLLHVPVRLLACLPLFACRRYFPSLSICGNPPNPCPVSSRPVASRSLSPDLTRYPLVLTVYCCFSRPTSIRLQASLVHSFRTTPKIIFIFFVQVNSDKENRSFLYITSSLLGWASALFCRFFSFLVWRKWQESNIYIHGTVHGVYFQQTVTVKERYTRFYWFTVGWSFFPVNLLFPCV